MKLFIGQKFKRLTIVSLSHRKNRAAFWNCICDCGNSKIISQSSLTTKKAQSCGCYFKEKITKHGLSYHPFYPIVSHQKNRCQNKNCKNYKDYGGRGIKFKFKSVAEAIIWYEKNLGTRPSSKHIIDRKNNNGHYEPSIKQMRWATKKEQNNNQRKSKKEKLNGRL